MFRQYKYDVAFSVAEEDIAMAQQIADALRLRGIKFYLYTDPGIEDWGKDLIDVTFRRYAKESKFTLLITSRTFVNKYWTGIENQVIQSYSLRKEDVLTLRIDDTSVDGLSQFKVFVRWQNNPDEIAAKIEKKVKKWKRRVCIRVSFTFSISSFLVALLIYFYSTNQHGRMPFPENQVVVLKDSTDTVRPAVTKVEGRTGSKKPEEKIPGNLIVEGTVRDDSTYELLDDVMVHVNRLRVLTKNGTFHIEFPGTVDRKSGDQITISYDFSKTGYKTKHQKQTIDLTNDITILNKDIILSKIK